MSDKIINYSAISDAPVNATPYPFFGIENAFMPASHEALLADFPPATTRGSLPL